MTLNDIIALISRCSLNWIVLQAHYVTVVEDRPITSAKYRVIWPKLSCAAVTRSLCDS